MTCEPVHGSFAAAVRGRIEEIQPPPSLLALTVDELDWILRWEPGTARRLLEAEDDR